MTHEMYAYANTVRSIDFCESGEYIYQCEAPAQVIPPRLTMIWLRRPRICGVSGARLGAGCALEDADVAVEAALDSLPELAEVEVVEDVDEDSEVLVGSGFTVGGSI